MTKREVRKLVGRRVLIKGLPNSVFNDQIGIIVSQNRGEQSDDEFDYGFKADGSSFACFQIPAGNFYLI